MGFGQFVNEMLEPTCECGGAINEEGVCETCGKLAVEETAEPGPTEEGEFPDITAENDPNDLNNVNLTDDDSVLEKNDKSRAEVLKTASKKFPNISAKGAQAGLGKMKGKDFKEKVKKNFQWADKPEAAAAAYIRKATKKEPKDV